MSISKKEQKQIQRFSPKQKMVIKVVMGGSIVLILTIILLIYINLQKTEEMKANDKAIVVSYEKPVDMIVQHIVIKQDSASSLRGVNYKPAKPLNASPAIK